MMALDLDDKQTLFQTINVSLNVRFGLWKSQEREILNKQGEMYYVIDKSIVSALDFFPF